MPNHPLIGKKAPEISLPNFNGDVFKFTPGTTGRPVALFFYPQSGTYGCTREACQFRDALSEEEVFKSSHVEVIGVSPDPVEKQKKFVEKHSLSYPILSDTKGEARKAYHVSKGLMGLTASSRVTFVISADGTIKDVLDTTINFAAHHKFVQNWLKGQAESSKATVTESDGTGTSTAPATARTTADEPPLAQPSTTAEPATTVSDSSDVAQLSVEPVVLAPGPAVTVPNVQVPASRAVA